MADLDDGFTRIANELLEALIGAELTRNQAKVAFAVARKTYGFNKPRDRISDGQLGEIANLPRQKVNKAKNELIAMKVLVSTGREIGINKVISDWKIDCHQNGDSVTKLVTKSVTKTVTEVSPKQVHTKDTIQKTINTITDGASACAETPSAAPQKVQSKNTPYQAILDAYHELLPEMPAIRELTDSRKTKIRNFWVKFKFNEDRWRKYLQFIAANCRWMCEGRQRRDGESAWKPKNLEFLITERCYLGVREGRFNDQ
ncbi:replication protein [Aeromonas hydrophila]|uniref:replication protein n=1 Tax=Aeromonas hydrophila TaxID=644 RepID=UPI00235E6F6D|nr:replication protein [Aeromonas hydrophila]